MVVHKRKKAVKYRGHVTHGGGHRKKRRGAGSRGGMGNAGTGKRAGHKKAGMKDRTLGRVGFLPRGSVRKGYRKGHHILNLDSLTSRLEAGVKDGTVKKVEGYYIVDLPRLGVVKLLSMGSCSLKIKVVAGKVSATAAEKITAAGGAVDIPPATADA